jgi:hypothetical protein
LPAGDRVLVARGSWRALALVASGAVGLLAAGCGGSRQDAGEKSATFTVKVQKASFPAKQAVSRPARMELRVTNTGSHTVPHLSITVDSFNYTSNYVGLAANKRPVWAIERGPGPAARPPVETQEVSQLGGGQTAYVNTWALGALAPNRTETFVWRVVPVKPGSYTVHYSVAAGLSGKAKVKPSEGAASGQFAVLIAAAPPTTYVDPATGKVKTGIYPSASGVSAGP